MKALVFNGPRDIRYESYDDPELISENSIVLKVEKCSICGSDLHIYHGDTIGKNSYTKEAPHFCVGHEFLGEVVETGPQVHQFKIGDKVLSSGGAGCGKCDKCKMGRPMECRRVLAFGCGVELQGGQAEYVSVPNADATLVKLTGEISDEHALLLTDAMPTAYFGLSRADVPHGGTVAIVGLGPIGIIGVELAFLLGASAVFAIDPVAARREQAERLGAQVFAPGKETIREIRSLTEGRGVDSVFEASGAKSSIDSVLSYVRYGGTVSFIGLPQPSDTLSMHKLLFKNVTVRGGVAPVPELWPALLPLVKSGRLKTPDLFSHNFKLSEGAEAYRMFDQKEDGMIKLMMHVD